MFSLKLPKRVVLLASIIVEVSIEKTFPKYPADILYVDILVSFIYAEMEYLGNFSPATDVVEILL